jgi:DNA-binding IclR family transcriptional regulator
MIHSATGQVFTAFAPRSETRDLVAKELRRSPMSKPQLDLLCEQIRRVGRAHVSGSVIPGLFATALPIFNLQGRPILTATLLWPESLRTSGEDDADDELAKICGTISSQLGWSPA